ncbi:ATP-binding protein [Kocuria kalidii]|uniref:sensor histidine kinase n=1 Tax=Kocuria kalidii TaxID=3376283 RepID=UPI0037A85726
MTEGRIRFATSILSRLGEELNPNIDQGIIELVKNAYDADASECHVWLENDEHGHPIIRIQDDGAGMSPSEIIDGWLVLGKSSKQTNITTSRGRRPAGNKGLGRLAALRLGRVATMSSRPTDDSQEYKVRFDWDHFDHANTIDEIDISIIDSPREKGAQNGTTIEIRNLRKPISRMEVKRLARSMILLADPFAVGINSFKPFLHTEEFDDVARYVSERYFSEADFHLVASNANGWAKAQILDWQGNVLYSATHEELRQKNTNKQYSGPDACFDLWAFNLSKNTFSTRLATLGEVKGWLQQFGGVHVYSNDLRVAPYGNPGNDWLDMNLARVRSPEERPSTNNSIGRLYIDDQNGILIQKTDRSGFIESPEFDELREFSIDALEWMARRRLEAAEARRRKAAKVTQTATQSSKKSVQEKISTIKDVDKKEEVEDAFARYESERNKEAEALKREVQLYRTLSTAGITSATFAHESNGNPLKRIILAKNAIDFGLQRELPELYKKKYRPPLDDIANATESLNVLAAATLRLIDHDKRRLARIQLDAVVKDVIETYKPFLDGRAVELTASLSEKAPYLQGTAAALEAIITNLINNSLSAFDRHNSESRRINVQSSVRSGVWELTISDNGPGIKDISLKDIWLPGETRRPGGTGLGLTIVRDAVSDLGGEIKAIAHGDLGGATFIIKFDILGD